QTTWVAAIHKSQAVSYREGRGKGLHFQDYKANGTTQFGYMVTSPYCGDVKADVDQQTISDVSKAQRGGYAFEVAGSYPWSVPVDDRYLIGKAEDKAFRQAYTDSATS